VPEDRFGDLGVPREEPARNGRSTAERLAELDEIAAADELQTRRKPPSRPAGRYMWVVGIAFVIALAVAGLNAIRHSGGGLRGPEKGTPLPAFAAPLATGQLDGVANVRQRAKQSNQAGSKPACQVHLPGSITSCALSRKPLVLAVIVPGVKQCETQLDLFQRLQQQYPKAQFAAVVSSAKRPKVATLVRTHHWTFPVAVDPDFAVFNLYRVAVCPTTVFAYPGGKVRETAIHPLGQAQIAAGLKAVGGA
jgi:peroxiredoxin